MRLSGYVAHPSQSRSNNRMQYLFLNGRHIRDSALQHALGEAYRGLLMTGRYPIAFLSLEMPPEMVDVNVHPTKLEVRFQDAGRLYSQLLSTLRSKFLTTDLTTLGQAPPASAKSPAAATTTPSAAKCGRNWSIGPRARWPAGNRRAAMRARGFGRDDGRGLAAAPPDGSTASRRPIGRGAEPLELTISVRPASALAAERRPPDLTRIDTPRCKLRPIAGPRS